jgi:hypothetical protein
MTAGPAQASRDAVFAVGEADQFGLPLDRDAEAAQPFDQQPLVLVLREDVQERVGRQTRADAFERQRAAASPFTQRLTAGTRWPLATRPR